MKIKITPFNNKNPQLKIDILINNNFYGCNQNYCGLVTEIKKSDDWIDQEMSWITRSELPIVTALRLSQLFDEYNMMLISGLIPIIKEEGPIYTIKEVSNFPNKRDCIYLLKEYCCSVDCNSYDFQRQGNEKEIKKIFKSFDYNNNLITRAGACLYKANILLRTSSAFAEEIYINSFIALEGIIEYLKLKHNIR